MVEKTIDGYLVVDWKQGTHRTRQSKPSQSELGKNELLAKLQVNVTVPEVDVPTLAVDIDVPEPQVYAATLEALEDEDLPDWTDAVHEVIQEYEFDPETNAAPMEDLVDIVTAQTLIRVNTRPDPNHVRDYVFEMLERVRSREYEAEAETDA